MPRVLFITTENLTGKSGSTVATTELFRAMADCDTVDLSLIAPTPDDPSVVPESVSSYWLTTKPAGTIKWHIRHQPSMARALFTALISERPELVIVRVGPSTVLPIVFGLLPGVEYKVLIRGFVHRNLSIQLPVKALTWANASVADETVVAFEAIAEMLRDLGVRGGISVVPNAVDPNRFVSDEGPTPEEIRDAVDDDAFVVGFVGSMEDRHRVDILVEAVASLPQSVKPALVLVGDGPQQTTLEELVKEAGIRDSTVFTGLVPHEVVPRYIASCDVLYGISDPDKPSNPIKIYEYLACERPVITTQTPELGFVEEERVGVAMDRVTVKSVHDALMDLYSMSSDERRTMGRRGREYVSENHSWSAVVDELIGVGT
ncbi:glycosyltransferase [Halorubrum sp. CGM5_25_10-8B]|nr:glycosyltransferase [Halorubrum sp. CGM5_25_10-8B]